FRRDAGRRSGRIVPDHCTRPGSRVFPALNVLMYEAGVADLFEFGNDCLIGEAVVEHRVDEGTDDLWKAGDFAGKTTRRFYRRQQRERRGRREIESGRAHDLIFYCTIMILSFSILSIHSGEGLTREGEET